MGYKLSNGAHKPAVTITAVETCCPVVELRQYVMKPGRRDDLITLFEEHFIEGQEKCGMRIIGQFRNRNDPDRFVWMRGFADMEARRKALEGFYDGPVWKEHRTAANDMMLDSDNVLLLKPTHTTSGFRLAPADRPTMDAPETAGGIVIATIYYFAAPINAKFVDFFETDLAPVLCSGGAALLGYFVTEPSENTFPRLPVREGEHVFVWLASFAGEATYAAHQTALANKPACKAKMSNLKFWLSKPEEILELAPSRRSLLRHRSAKEIVLTSQRL